jgi:hypothetical protein
MIQPTVKKLYSIDSVCLLKNYIKFTDEFTLKFCNLQATKFQKNISELSFVHTLDNSSVFSNIQQFHYDELCIFLSGWGKAYVFEDLVKNKTFNSIIPTVTERYGKDFHFFEVADSLILSGCPAVLVFNTTLQETINKINIFRLLGDVFDIPITIAVSIDVDAEIINNSLMYAEYADIIWIKDNHFDKDLSIELSKKINQSFPNKILGYKYCDNLLEYNNILKENRYKFSDIEYGWMPDINLKF